ncbi:MAG TPA: hypothetical protein VLL28_07955 [Hyphomicrobiaceae bacterium]|nr:hypothetical protein [Hyphomicrobiaceae bacterium]
MSNASTDFVVTAGGNSASALFIYGGVGGTVYKCLAVGNTGIRRR